MVIDGPRTTRATPSVSTVATSMPSSEVPLISPIARRTPSFPCRGGGRGSGSGPEGGGPWAAVMLDDGAMSTPRSSFLAAATERGFVHQCTDLDALDAR